MIEVRGIFIALKGKLTVKAVIGNSILWMQTCQ
nr:MAG TPA: hypothetical protein [Caudoviricetes sp.]